jgi:hypothetical protein
VSALAIKRETPQRLVDGHPLPARVLSRGDRMRTTWRGHSLWLTPAYVLSLALGGQVTPHLANPNTPGGMEGFDSPDLQLVIEEGRLQMDHAAGKFEHVQSRAQALLTVGLAVLAFATGAFARLDRVSGWEASASGALFAVAMLLVLLGVGLAGAVVVVRADFQQIDTTQVSNMQPPIAKPLAADYAESVRRGEITVAERVTVFRLATRYTVWGAVFIAAVHMVTA